jgi:predicted transposase YbfD/YdcC
VKLEFKKSFSRDLRKHNLNKALLQRVQEVILVVEQTDSIREIGNLKIVSGLAIIALGLLSRATLSVL